MHLNSAASHLPFNRNGLKFFTSQGGASKADISNILSLADEAYQGMTPQTVEANQQRAQEVFRKVDFMKRYASDLVEAVRKGANGMGPKISPFVLLFIHPFVYIL